MVDEVRSGKSGDNSAASRLRNATFWQRQRSVYTETNDNPFTHYDPQRIARHTPTDQRTACSHSPTQ